MESLSGRLSMEDGHVNIWDDLGFILLENKYNQ